MSNHNFADDVHDEHMGLMCSYRWKMDPKTILFVLARYKFVAKMLAGYGSVLEVGCADGFGSHIVRSSVGLLTGIDIDAQMIESARTLDPDFLIRFFIGDMASILERDGGFDAAYALDVLEHVEPKDEHAFMSDFLRLAPIGIIGMPSLESQAYASPLSAQNHCNCKTEDGLRETMRKHYRHVFMFGMNDEVVHTGFGQMCHYRFALGVK